MSDRQKDRDWESGLRPRHCQEPEGRYEEEPFFPAEPIPGGVYRVGPEPVVIRREDVPAPPANHWNNLWRSIVGDHQWAVPDLSSPIIDFDF